jgi:hypothetical protein
MVKKAATQHAHEKVAHHREVVCFRGPSFLAPLWSQPKWHHLKAASADFDALISQRMFGLFFWNLYLILY